MNSAFEGAKSFFRKFFWRNTQEEFDDPETLPRLTELVGFFAVTIMAGLVSSLLLRPLLGFPVVADPKKIDMWGVGALLLAVVLLMTLGIARVAHVSSGYDHVDRLYRLMEAMLVAPVTALLGAGWIWLTWDRSIGIVAAFTVGLVVACACALFWYIHESEGPKVASETEGDGA